MSAPRLPAVSAPRCALRALAVTVLAASLAGCAVLESHGDPEYSLLGGGSDRVNSAGVHQMLGPEFERLDLVRLLAVGQDDSAAQAQAMQTCQAQAARGDEYLNGCLIDLAFSRYHADAARDTPAHRNAIQDRILSASDQRCNVFLTYIQRHQSATDFFLGSLTTLLAGGGAIATGVDTARALAGSAGIVSGVRAEYDQTYFQNQAATIISKGIRLRRDTLLSAIDAKRGSDVGSYTIERAVGDALRYHGACTVMAGLEETDTQLSATAGVEAMARTLQTVVQVQQQAQAVGTADSAAPK